MDYTGPEINSDMNTLPHFELKTESDCFVIEDFYGTLFYGEDDNHITTETAVTKLTTDQKNGLLHFRQEVHKLKSLFTVK